MTHRTYTIGEASRLSGISVRRLRFYCDKGLLPPAGRTDSGYRVFTREELIRLDLICCLRDAGLGLDAIRQVLSRQLSLRDALTLRLHALETDIAAQRRIASALRMAIRSPELTEIDLRRFWTMTDRSRIERRKLIERFYKEVSDGIDTDPDWIRQMIEASVPDLPDDPTPEQCDAWIELSEIVNDPNFIANMRSNARELWDRQTFDPATYQKASESIIAEAKDAIARGLEPMSTAGDSIAQRWLETTARLMGREPDHDFKTWLSSKYAAHDPRSIRYWELVAVMKGQAPDSSPHREWSWIVDAMKHHLAKAE